MSKEEVWGVRKDAAVSKEKVGGVRKGAARKTTPAAKEKKAWRPLEDAVGVGLSSGIAVSAKASIRASAGVATASKADVTVRPPSMQTMIQTATERAAQRRNQKEAAAWGGGSPSAPHALPNVSRGSQSKQGLSAGEGRDQQDRMPMHKASGARANLDAAKPPTEGAPTKATLTGGRSAEVPRQTEAARPEAVVRGTSERGRCPSSKWQGTPPKTLATVSTLPTRTTCRETAHLAAAHTSATVKGDSSGDPAPTMTMGSQIFCLAGASVRAEAASMSPPAALTFDNERGDDASDASTDVLEQLDDESIACSSNNQLSYL